MSRRGNCLDNAPMGSFFASLKTGVRPPRPLPNPRACQGGYGVASVYQGAAPGPTVMFRAELDGLPIEEVADIPPPLRRTELNALLYRLRTGCPWRMLPRAFPPRRTVDGYVQRFRQEGVG